MRFLSLTSLSASLLFLLNLTTALPILKRLQVGSDGYLSGTLTEYKMSGYSHPIHNTGGTGYTGYRYELGNEQPTDQGAW
ncbi:MAG: hypothetical protein LQ339_004130 [Xanthoria mediterranea]|nr:MAG: hypothetical protein LQ339_004130 [Xanthoria mediterranea]